jgi:hypothetical protein
MDKSLTKGLLRNWRKEDPPARTVGELSPEDLGGRVVIRAASGTIYGTLFSVSASHIPNFSIVQLMGKAPMTVRDDFEAIVVDDLRPRARVVH